MISPIAKTVLTAITLLFSGLGVLAQDSRLPVYEVARVDQPIQIDGRLDEKAWKEAKPVGDFVNNRDGTPSNIKTEARILYSDKFIFFAFRAVDSNIWSTFKRRDEHLWLEEVVEVFLQASAQPPNYIELEVNPLGTMLDIYLLDTRKPIPYESWNSKGLKWAVQVDGSVDGRDGDREWTCEIALPFVDVVTAPNNPPKPGDRWRMNLFRVERKPAVAEVAWSPTLQDDFHVLPRLGELVFSDRVVPKK